MRNSRLKPKSQSVISERSKSNNLCQTLVIILGRIENIQFFLRILTDTYYFASFFV
jgi:hypothetical protein